MVRKYAFDLVFQNAAARLAYTPVPGDSDKVAVQMDDRSYWILRPGETPTWAPMGAPALMVVDHGVACDGATDDGPALQALLDKLGSAEQTLVFTGNCVSNQNLTFPPNLFLLFLWTTSSVPFAGTGTVAIEGSMLQAAPEKVALRSHGVAEIKLDAADGSNIINLIADGDPDNGAVSLNLASGGGSSFAVTANGRGDLEITAINGADQIAQPVNAIGNTGWVFNRLGVNAGLSLPGGIPRQLIDAISWVSVSVTGQTITANSTVSATTAREGHETPPAACSVGIPLNMPSGIFVQARVTAGDVELTLLNVTNSPIVVPSMTFEVITFSRAP